MSWDFSKLPKERKDEVKTLLESNNISALIVIHDEFELSNYDYFDKYTCKAVSTDMI